jgi:hypothetical protein
VTWFSLLFWRFFFILPQQAEKSNKKEKKNSLTKEKARPYGRAWWTI